MADQRKITLYPGHGTPQNIILRALPIATLAAGTTIYLYPGHAADKNIILRNPLVAEAAGTPGPITANLTVTFDGVTLTGAAVLPIAAAATLTFDDLSFTTSASLAGASTGDHPVSILLSPIWHIPFTLPTRVLSDNAVGFLTQFVDVINGTMTATDVVTSSIANLKINVGTGSPEGSVVGSPPDIYLNRAGGAATTLYIKQSGNSTTTGWVAK